MIDGARAGSPEPAAEPLLDAALVSLSLPSPPILLDPAVELPAEEDDVIPAGFGATGGGAVPKRLTGGPPVLRPAPLSAAIRSAMDFGAGGESGAEDAGGGVEAASVELIAKAQSQSQLAIFLDEEFRRPRS